MRDIFYTILIVWIIWRIINSVNTMRVKKAANSNPGARKPGETTVDYIPPREKGKYDGEGEYVDYEEIK